MSVSQVFILICYRTVPWFRQTGAGATLFNACTLVSEALEGTHG